MRLGDTQLLPSPTHVWAVVVGVRPWMLQAMLFYVGAALLLLAGAVQRLVPEPDVSVRDKVRWVLVALWRARADVARDPVVRGVCAGVVLGGVSVALARPIPGPAGLVAAVACGVAARVAKDRDRKWVWLGRAAMMAVWALPSLVYLRG